MTALKGKAIEAFVARRDPKIAAILVYGPDLGLVRERADKIAAQICPDFKDPFNYIELSDADLKSDPARLTDEAAALSMMGGDRVVRIRTTGETATPAAKLVVAGLEGGYLKPTGIVIIEGGDLAKSSGLRKLFEGSKAVIALPCYADAPADMRALSQAAAREENLTIESDALDLLVALLGEDRGVSRAEIEKLILFKGPKALRDGPASVTIDDIRAVLVDTISDAASEAAAAAADGAAARLARALHRSATAGASPIGTVRALQREFSRLRTARAAMAEGASAEAAMAKLRPPVFFMEKRAFEERLRRWSLRKLDAALAILLEAELGAKSTGLPDAEIVERAALRIAAMAA
ncbi:MAG TPA: DNA polymerase III subunit delta [Parvularculaceae bacterium]|nr:DNA polymerase III subunit delta [Parvularculaceae bacterium]HNS86616.1 DNA polymerase III subunit delta [Parvularculaceae bacterium]